MALAHVQGFLASDGKFFFKDQGLEAKQYEDRIQFLSWCRTNICVGGEWTSDMVARAILESFTVTPK